MRRLIAYARQRGIHEIFGKVLDWSTVMLKLCQELKFSVEHEPQDPGFVIARL